MLWTLLQDRKSRIRLLVWLVRASAIALIAGIGIFQFVLGSGFNPAALAPSYLSASLNFGRDEHGKFELSVAMQPNQAKAMAAGPKDGAPEPDAKLAVKVLAAPQGQPGALPASISGQTGKTPQPGEADSPDASLKDKTVACALPASPRQTASDGKLMLVSFATDAGRVDGYGVNDTVFAPGVAKLTGYTLPVLEWVRNQGALSGYRHAVSAKPPARSLPLPNVLGASSDDGTGDYVMSVAHGAVDFLAVGSGDFATELNLWYHSLNAGFRTRIMGEVPCRTAELPSMNGARSNILPVSISESRRAMMSGNLYVSDGRTKIQEFKVNGRGPASEVGSEVRLGSSGTVSVVVSLATRLDEKRPDAPPSRNGWNVENARIGDTQLVSVEAIVNGQVAAARTITADGREQKLEFNLPLRQSSWIAIRIKGAAHTNPVFVLVDNMPVRASKASVEWILRSLLELYQTTNPRWIASQSANARSAYEYSYAVYQKILSETNAP